MIFAKNQVRIMLQASRRVVSLANISFSGYLSGPYKAHYSACGPTEIKEAPILDNKCVVALPEEMRMRNILDATIMVSTMVDLTPVNGIPAEILRTRRVRIFRPVKNVMQSGTNNLSHWLMEFDNQKRWENPLMGWTTSVDPLSCLTVRFTQLNEAIEHCQKNGWMWYLDVPRTENEYRPKDYGHNFSWNKRTRVSTK